MQEEKNTITIKVNGKDKPINEIKKDNEIAAALDNRSEDQPFDWVLPDETKSSNVIHFSERLNGNGEDQSDSAYFTERTPGLPIHRKRKRLPLQKPERNKVSWQIPKRFLAPIVGAIMVGGIIGIIVLMIFTGDKFESQTPAVAQSDLLTQDTDGNQLEKTTGDSNAAATTIDLTLKTYIVQGGLFSSSENADERIDMVTENGFAAVRSAKDNRVFIGIAPTIDAANQLADEYESVVPDAYAPKTGWTIDAPSVPVPKSSDLNWVVNGRELFAELINKNLEDIDASTKAINDWKKEALKGIEKLPAEHQEKAVAFVNSLTSLSGKSDSEWDYQQGLLDIFVAYQAFVLDLQG